MLGDLYGGKGPMVNGVQWMLTAVAVIVVGLRFYTRKFILNSVSWDDYMMIPTLALLFLMSITISISATFGLGRSTEDVLTHGTIQDYVTATYWEFIAQIAGILVVITSKASVGCFLLRIVENRWHIAIIWFCMLSTGFLYIFCAVMVFAHCTPAAKSYNPSVPGVCWFDFPKLGLATGAYSVVMDFAFAMLPMFIIWKLNMKVKEKRIVAGGLSLGIFAGVCGIIRTKALTQLDASEYILDTLGLLLWSTTETVVTIICATVPVLRPLYSKMRYGSKGSSNDPAGSYQLPSYNKNDSNNIHQRNRSRVKSLNLWSTNDGGDSKNGGLGHQTLVKYGGAALANNTSDESILRDSKKQNGGSSSTSNAIHRVDEVSISYSK
ncbi:hypothetical protein GGR56DRAFT_475523 [Xylariaceae sp. FL0804]|nr:hypothetical protein GGR56DRAFT_475523 [Xylariaceae sp. FL0804]